jgi:hypothetical protein
MFAAASGEKPYCCSPDIFTFTIRTVRGGSSLVKKAEARKQWNIRA